jgi:hypothetical protein
MLIKQNEGAPHLAFEMWVSTSPPILSLPMRFRLNHAAVRRTERPFWQARYYDFNVFTQRKHVEKLKYMHEIR